MAAQQLTPRWEGGVLLIQQKPNVRVTTRLMNHPHRPLAALLSCPLGLNLIEAKGSSNLTCRHGVSHHLCTNEPGCSGTAEACSQGVPLELCLTFGTMCPTTS
jgi:hypothetical protein